MRKVYFKEFDGIVLRLNIFPDKDKTCNSLVLLQESIDTEQAFYPATSIRLRGNIREIADWILANT